MLVPRSSAALSTLFEPFLHPQTDFKLVRDREVLEAEGFARPDTDAREFRTDRLIFWQRRCKLQDEVDVFEEVGLRQFLVDLREVNGRRSRRRRLVELSRKRLSFVTGLDLLHTVHIVVAE
jgi:hypothetical protein